MRAAACGAIALEETAAGAVEPEEDGPEADVRGPRGEFEVEVDGDVVGGFVGESLGRERHLEGWMG